MKKNKLIIADEAQIEMEEIAQKYRNLVGSKAASKITNRIYGVLEHLCVFPNMGIAIDEEEIGESGYRKLICGNYLIFYRIVDEVIYIYHVADGRNEYKQLFKS